MNATATDTLHVIAERVRSASNVVALTGAGLSAASGLPTFRGEDGLWKRFRAEYLASQDGFADHPDEVWEWYRWRRKMCRKAEPNAGHLALAAIAGRVRKLVVVTQNVDGLHQRAGSTDVIELHGNIHRDRCNACGAVQPKPAPETGLPRCGCGGLLRPDVVWFGEMIPPDALDRATREARGADVLLTVGTAGAVYPAAEIPAIAAESGAFAAEFNVERTPITSVHHVHVSGPADRTLSELAALVAS